jgi:UDP-glucose 4-epimerase
LEVLLMRVLITGGAGFIGSHVVDACLRDGHTVSVVDNLSTGHQINLNPEAVFYHLDIRDATALSGVFEKESPEVVIHHAAQVNVRNSVADPVLDAQINIIGSINVLQAARKVRARKVIYASSGGTVYGEPQSTPCLESHPILPLCPYGASKYIVEQYLHLYHKNYGLVYTVLRYGNVYGPRQDPAGEAGVIAIFITQMLQDSKLVIYDDGNQVRDYVYVQDCARANLLALDKGDGHVLNIGSGQPTTVNEIFNVLQSLTAYPNPPCYAPPRQGEIYRTYLDISLAQQVLDWRPKVNLKQGLQRTLRAFENYNN